MESQADMFVQIIGCRAETPFDKPSTGLGASSGPFDAKNPLSTNYRPKAMSKKRVSLYNDHPFRIEWLPGTDSNCRPSG
jgi:hypothetical protein